MHLQPRALSADTDEYAPVRASTRLGAGTRPCRSRAPCACACAVQMANLIRDWHCFLGDEPKDVDREIRCEAYAIPSCAPVAPPCACVGIMTCSMVTGCLLARSIDTFCACLRTCTRTASATPRKNMLTFVHESATHAEQRPSRYGCRSMQKHARSIWRERQPASSLAFESLHN